MKSIYWHTGSGICCAKLMHWIIQDYLIHILTFVIDHIANYSWWHWITHLWICKQSTYASNALFKIMIGTNFLLLWWCKMVSNGCRLCGMVQTYRKSARGEPDNALGMFSELHVDFLLFQYCDRLFTVATDWLVFDYQGLMRSHVSPC